MFFPLAHALNLSDTGQGYSDSDRETCYHLKLSRLDICSGLCLPNWNWKASKYAFWALFSSDQSLLYFGAKHNTVLIPNPSLDTEFKELVEHKEKDLNKTRRMAFHPPGFYNPFRFKQVYVSAI